MEEREGNVARVGSFLASASLKTSLSWRSSSRKSNSFRRLGSVKTPRRDSKDASGKLRWLLRNRLFFLLILIVVWAYVGFHVQSKWAHNDQRKASFIGYRSNSGNPTREDGSEVASISLVSNSTNSSLMARSVLTDTSKESKLKEKFSVNLAENRKRSEIRKVDLMSTFVSNGSWEMNDGLQTWRNVSHGLIVGPLSDIEDRVLEWSPDKRRGTCDRAGEFARTVWSRTFVLVFHELSMTGAPLSMMELASEILSCGGYVSVVVLSRKGGLMTELNRRGIKVIKDKSELSYKFAKKADLVIAGSAVCSSWIEQYLLHFPAGSNKLVWWIMENRREYFNRSKLMLNRTQMLMFLSETQLEQWLEWCEGEKVQLISHPMIVPLSVNDELAFVAGFPCSLNTPQFSVAKMLEKKDLLRAAVRKEMSLDENDTLLISLSSINPGKGQKLLLESILLVAENNISMKGMNFSNVVPIKSVELSLQNYSVLYNQSHKIVELLSRNSSLIASKKKKKRKKRKKWSRLVNFPDLRELTRAETGSQQMRRHLLSETNGDHDHSLKVLIGSVGSKSNKALYVKEIISFLSRHSTLSNLVMWAPATTRVASLYAAADVYIINAQGLGETFGRVTIEAMAFGLPVLGTDAGGTKEIVVHGVTGLLHPPGHQGTQILAQNINFLLKNPSTRKKMGMNGRMRAHNIYSKPFTYAALAKVILHCLKS